MEYLGEITDTRQHEHQVNVVYPVGKNEYVWPEKTRYYYLMENIVCKIDPPVTIRNGLHDCFVIPRYIN